MKIAKIVVWKGAKFWLGHFQDYPDYWTQGKTLKELRENLADLYGELVDGDDLGIRRVEELAIPGSSPRRRSKRTA